MNKETAPLNLTPIDRQSVEQLTTDTLKSQLDQALTDANMYREATDLKEDTIAILLDILKQRGEPLDNLIKEG